MSSKPTFDPGKSDEERNRLAARDLFCKADGTALSQEDARTLIGTMKWRQQSSTVYDALISLETLAALSIDQRRWHELEIPVFASAIGAKPVRYFQIGHDFAHIGILAYLEDMAGKEWAEANKFSSQQDLKRSQTPIK